MPAVNEQRTNAQVRIAETLMKLEEDLLTETRALDAATRGSAEFDGPQRDQLARIRKRQKGIGEDAAKIARQFEELVVDIGAFANARKVSRKMVAYNMLRERLIDGGQYRRLAARFDEDRLEFPRRAAKGAPDYYVVRRHRVGQGLLNLVDRMVAGGALTTTKAGKVLGVKPTAIGRMTEQMA